ncbi:MAG: hypothetical protein ACI9J2_002245 [Saprospiraceae bacterium]|jgi:hypothetical protein
MNITKESFVEAMAASSVLANLTKLTASSKSGLLDMGLASTTLFLVIVGLGGDFDWHTAALSGECGSI